MGTRTSTRLFALAMLVAASSALATMPSGAQAASATSTTTNTPMNVQPVTSVGAPDASGNVSVTLQNGQVIQVPKKYAKLVANPEPPAASTSGVHTDATVYGNCGYSYVNLMEKSNGYPVRMTTGFHTYDASIEYHWNAGIGGPQYQYNYNAGGSLAARHDWNGSHNSGSNYPHGDYFASVSTSNSWAMLYWGGICTSGGPVTSAFL